MPTRTGTKRKASSKAANSNRRWLELAAEFPLRPIRSEAAVVRAIALIDRLTDQPELTDEESDYRDSLAHLVADYEDEHEPEGDVSPAGMLHHLLDSRGVDAKRAAAGAGLSEATLCQILAGKREPSRKTIAALAKFFKVDPAVFL